IQCDRQTTSATSPSLDGKNVLKEQERRFLGREEEAQYCLRSRRTAERTVRRAMLPRSCRCTGSSLKKQKYCNLDRSRLQYLYVPEPTRVGSAAATGT